MTRFHSNAKIILTVDVEDNFTVDELKYKSDWGKYEGQVVCNTEKILSLLESINGSATFFIVGKVAERHPELVKRISSMGHELASHSYSHIPLVAADRKVLEREIGMGAQVIENITGEKVKGFRSMGFSIPQDKKTFYETLKKYGYEYDSSSKFALSEDDKFIKNCGVSKFYLPYFKFMKLKLAFSGGTYLRILPSYIIKKGIDNWLKKSAEVMLYVHPWEFNRDQPIRNVSLKQKILQSSLTYTTESKIKGLMEDYKFISIQSLMDNKT